MFGVFISFHFYVRHCGPDGGMLPTAQPRNPENVCAPRVADAEPSERQPQFDHIVCVCTREARFDLSEQFQFARCAQLRAPDDVKSSCGQRLTPFAPCAPLGSIKKQSFLGNLFAHQIKWFNVWFNLHCK